ncbi:MAG: peroxiredoxin [Alphaproteobacteria bacterium]|nr:peroxiredoxin [Alphaproteobacteria bacterium]
MAKIKVGARVPSGKLQSMKDGRPAEVSTADLFKGKRVALFSVPGAFTPTCSNAHLPGFVKNARALKAKGIDTIACLSVNDAFVMGAWGKAQKVGDKVIMLADGNAAYTDKLGLGLDARKWGMGRRGMRFSMVVDNGVVTQLNVDTSGLKDSSAEAMLEKL